MEKSKLNGQIEKLQGVCDENNLVYRFCCDTYPISLTIRACSGVGVQLSLLEKADEDGYTSPNAFIRFSYEDGDIEYKTSETFSISDALFTKIKLIFKRMHQYYLQYFFRYIIENELLKPANFPEVKDIESSKRDQNNENAADEGEDDYDGYDDNDEDNGEVDAGGINEIGVNASEYSYEPVAARSGEALA